MLHNWQFSRIDSALFYGQFGAMDDQGTKSKASEAPWPIFDGLMKIYALLSFTMFVAIVFVR